MNTGFSWVRIDKGNIHCNFRYLDSDQVRTVINYLKSYYEYQNVTANIVDLTGALPPDAGSSEQYRPSGADSNEHYYYLVELYRHGTIIPQGCVEIMKSAINGIAMNKIIPESVFINKLKTNMLTVDDEETLTAVQTVASTNPVQWASSDLAVITITPDGMSCDIVAAGPGTAQIEASVQVEQEVPRELTTINNPSAYWTDNVWKYVGNTITYKVYHGKLYPSTYEYGESFTFTQNSYYECVYDATVETHYKWINSSYDGTPLTVTYKDIYELFVRTYIKILTKEKQRLCLYHFEEMQATTPSSGLTIQWYSSSDSIDFDSDISTGDTVMIEGKKVGSSTISATVTDAYGTYEDSVPVTVYAIDANPNSLKMVTGSTKYAYVAKKDIFSIDPAIVVDWVTSNGAIASVTVVDPPTDPTTDFAECAIVAQGVGQAFVSAIAEDPVDGTSYSDSIKVTVGNVAIDTPASSTIYLLSGTTTLTITCDLAAGFTIDGSIGWISGNTDVLEITSVSGTDNETVVVTGLAEGTSMLSVTGRNGSAVDTDQILITVVDADYVTSGEMATFTHGQFNGHGVIDWNHPTGEEGTLEVDGTGLDLATESEVDDFVEDLFDEDAEESEESTEENDG